MRGDRVVGGAGTESGADVESPQVPRTDDLVADEVSLRQRTAAVRTGVVGGEESAGGVRDGDGLVADLHGPDAADWNFGRVQDLGKGFVHRTRTVAKAMSVNLFTHRAVCFPIRLF